MTRKKQQQETEQERPIPTARLVGIRPIRVTRTTEQERRFLDVLATTNPVTLFRREIERRKAGAKARGIDITEASDAMIRVAREKMQQDAADAFDRTKRMGGRRKT